MEKNKSEISKGVMSTLDTPHCVIYQIACDCGDKDHNATIMLEYEDRFLVLSFYKDLEINTYWQHENFFQRTWRKIKYAYTILFKGYLNLECEFLLQDVDHIDAFIKALKRGKVKILNQIELEKRQDG